MTKHAYYVGDEESAEIVFAESEAEAIATGKGKLFLGDYVDAKRSPEWDEFASLGYVPPNQLIASGWSHECHECLGEVDELTPNPVFDSQLVFCCQECADSWHSKRKAKEGDRL